MSRTPSCAGQAYLHVLFLTALHLCPVGLPSCTDRTVEHNDKAMGLVAWWLGTVSRALMLSLLAGALQACPPPLRMPPPLSALARP